jgi:DNA-binding MarR family transcriptional regulator
VKTHVPEHAVRVLKQFRVIFRAVKEHYRRVEMATGLSGSHVWALVIIDENPGIRPGSLTDRLAIHQSTASNIVRHLVSEDDARAFELSATPKARELLARVPEPKIGILVQALAEMPQTSVSGLEGYLDHVIARMGQSGDAEAGLKPLADL